MESAGTCVRGALRRGPRQGRAGRCGIWGLQSPQEHRKHAAGQTLPGSASFLGLPKGGKKRQLRTYGKYEMLMSETFHFFYIIKSMT